ncbi:MAG: hypothetical protein Q4G49_06895 [Paracoccus sp. (in: a-proteobacteria)]|nr:hypothetical protein [Paracoccus sp. (in: a-proteobacteria)]
MRATNHCGAFALTIGCAFLGWTAAAEAQDAAAPVLMCGGETASWIGGSAAQSDATAGAALQTEAPLSSGARTVVAFRVTAADQPLRIEAVPAGRSGDPAIEVLDAAGTGVADNDDFGDSLASRIEQALPAGDYCLVIEALSGQDGAVGNIQIATTDAVPLGDAADEGAGYDEGEIASGAIATCLPETPAIALDPALLNRDTLSGGPLRMVLDMSPSPEYLRFSVDQTVPLTLRANSNSLDPVMTLFGAQGEQLQSNDDSDEGLNARLDFPAGLPVGDYCIGVTAYESGAGQIELVAETFDEAALLRGAYDRGEMAPPRDGSIEVVTLNLDEARETVALVGTKARWFRFSVDRRMAVMISGFGGGSDTDAMLMLFASGRQKVAENDDTGGSLNPQVGPVVLEPGEYDLALRLHGGEGAGMMAMRPVQLVFERFLPEQ